MGVTSARGARAGAEWPPRLLLYGTKTPKHRRQRLCQASDVMLSGYKWPTRRSNPYNQGENEEKHEAPRIFFGQVAPHTLHHQAVRRRAVRTAAAEEDQMAPCSSRRDCAGWFTSAWRTFPAVNQGTFFAGISTGAPVFGLRPARG